MAIGKIFHESLARKDRVCVKICLHVALETGKADEIVQNKADCNICCRVQKAMFGTVDLIKHCDLKLYRHQRTLAFKTQFLCAVLLLFASPLPSLCFNSTVEKHIDSEKPIDKLLFLELPQACPKLCRCYNGEYDISSAAPMLADVKTNTDSRFITSCVQAGITEFPTFFPRNTSTILMDQNNIKILDYAKRHNESLIHGLNKYETVTQLNCQENQLQRIERFVFQDFPSIQTLLLSHNRISNLIWTAGLSGASLLHLDVSFNRISTLNKGDFEQMSSLKRLDLSNNDIESIGPFAFESLHNLEYLDLSSNDISNHGLHQRAFNKPSGLSFLSFANNRLITRVPRFDVLGLEPASLEVLDLHGLHFMTSIESAAFDGMSSLKSLNLSFCALSTLKLGWLNGGPSQSLEILDLSYNRFTEIKSGFFVAADIDLKMETYSTEPQPDADSFSYVVSPSVLEPKSHLSFVKYEGHLSASQERSLYRSLQKLAWLSLSDNRNLASLEDDAFNFLPSLQYLFLQKCNISKIKLASANQQYSDQGIILTLPNLKGIWTFDNPMYCDCHVRVLRTETSSFVSNCPTNNTYSERLNDSALVLLDAEGYFFEGRCKNVTSTGKSRCFPRQSIETFPIETVPQSYLFCPQEPMSLFIAMCIGPLAFAASIFLVFLCGWLTVLISRARRGNSGYYRLNGTHDNKTTEPPHNTTAQHNRVHKSTSSRPTKITRNIPRSQGSPATSNRPNYGTNLVLGNFSTGSSVGAQISKGRVGFSRPLSRSPSPSRMRKRRKKYLSPVPSIFVENKSGSCNVEHVQFSNSGLSNSYPNISNKTDTYKDKNEYWKHTLPVPSSQITSTNSFESTSDNVSKLLHYIDEDATSHESETEFLVVPRQVYHGAETSSSSPSCSSMSGSSKRYGANASVGYKPSCTSFENSSSRLITRKKRSNIHGSS